MLLKSKIFWTLAITEEVKTRAVKAKVEQRRVTRDNMGPNALHTGTDSTVLL